MSAAGPLRGPGKDKEGGGFAAAHIQGAPRRLRGRSSGLKGALAFPAEMASGHPCPRRPRRPLEAGNAVRPRACPGQARGARSPPRQATAGTRTPGQQVNWRSIVRRTGGKITQIQARLQAR